MFQVAIRSVVLGGFILLLSCSGENGGQRNGESVADGSAGLKSAELEDKAQEAAMREKLQASLDQFGQKLIGTDLHDAVITRDSKKVEALLKGGANANARGGMGSAIPLQLLARNPTPSWHEESVDLEIADLLIKYGADVNGVAPDGTTPLHDAVMMNNTLITKVLLEHGTKVDARMGQSGSTSLHIATLSPDTEIVEILLKAGADVNATRDSDGSTPLDLAEKGENQKMMAILRRYGALRSSDLKEAKGRS